MRAERKKRKRRGIHEVGPAARCGGKKRDRCSRKKKGRVTFSPSKGRNEGLKATLTFPREEGRNRPTYGGGEKTLKFQEKGTAVHTGKKGTGAGKQKKKRDGRASKHESLLAGKKDHFGVRKKERKGDFQDAGREGEGKSMAGFGKAVFKLKKKPLTRDRELEKEREFRLRLRRGKRPPKLLAEEKRKGRRTIEERNAENTRRFIAEKRNQLSSKGNQQGISGKSSSTFSGRKKLNLGQGGERGERSPGKTAHPSS